MSDTSPVCQLWRSLHINRSLSVLSTAITCLKLHVLFILSAHVGTCDALHLWHIKMETSGTFVFMPTDTTPHVHNKQIKKGAAMRKKGRKTTKKRERNKFHLSWFKFVLSQATGVPFTTPKGDTPGKFNSTWECVCVWLSNRIIWNSAYIC